MTGTLKNNNETDLLKKQFQKSKLNTGFAESLTYSGSAEITL